MAQTLHLKCKTLIRPTKLKITEAFQEVEATGDMAPKIGYNALRKYRQSRGGTQQSFIQEGSNPRSNPLPVYTQFLIETVTILYTFHWQLLMVGAAFTYLV